MFPVPRFPILWVFLIPLLFTSCSVVEYAPESAPRMLIQNNGTPFFHHGPGQTSGADRTLSQGEFVWMLRKEFGYSFVRLGDGEKGYVDNEALLPAPEEQPPLLRRKQTLAPAGALPSFRY